MTHDDTTGYHPLARAFHWLVAVLVFAVWPLGAVIEYVKDDAKTSFYLWHESLGFTVLWLMLARLCVRFLTRRPPRPAMPRWQAGLADSVQWALYLALIAMPISGFLATNAHGFPLEWFGLLPVWSPIGKAPDLAPVLSSIHGWISWTILALVITHVLGALYHRIWRHDDLLSRML
ncbi:cytochrome b/b6 domain-containing protein [Salinisphaera sp. T31B1]|uniref:cytochrome b n=1 Tax=Salinisphaera sp. T31B1 TaxID=727963 RepID=UPI00333E22DA